jgi:hypothetical protein
MPHSGCDRSPIRQLRSLLRHPRRCGALWDLRRGTQRARHYSPHYSTNSGRPDSTSSHVWPRTHLLLRKGSGDAACPSKRDAQHTQPESRTSPLEGFGTSTQPSDLLSARTSTLSRGVRDRRVPRHRRGM